MDLKFNLDFYVLVIRKILGIMRVIIFGLIGLFLLNSCNNQEVNQSISKQIAMVQPEDLENIQFGFDFNTFCVLSDEIDPNQVLSDILLPYQISYQSLDELVRNTSEVFDTRKIRAGHEYHVLCDPDAPQKAKYFIYEKSPESYVVYEFGNDSVSAYIGQHDVEIRLREVGGVINSSLYMTLQNNDVSPALAMEMADVYAWTIDFYRIQKGDNFKVIFEERYINDERVGVGEVIAANFNHGGEDFYAFSYDQNGVSNYFDDQGLSCKKAFLKSPLKFSRISSRYSLNRKHPVTGRNKPHFGTDYAAPTGTPIMAVGDGVVIKSERKRNNGNYVKIRHNDTYTTQYLHMSKRLCQVGDVVKQGDIIGLVGSTGLATGPHVCFRFWKHGKQVDHLKEKFIPADPIAEGEMESFLKHIESLKPQLDAIEMDSAPKSKEDDALVAEK